MGTDVSFPSGKIPISTLESYSYCKKQGILSLRKKEIRKKDTKKKVIGRILHEVFKNFHEEWTDIMYSRREKQCGINRLKLILEAAVDQARVIMESDPSYLAYEAPLNKGFKRMMEGRNGFVSQISNAATKLAKNNDLFRSDELPRTYFKGDPKFEWEVGLEHSQLYGRIDCLVEKEQEREFFIWEFKTGIVPDEPFEGHILEAVGYAVAYEQESKMKCIGLKILYYGEKEFDIAFTDFHRDKVNSQVQELFDYEETGEIPHIIMGSKCNECDFYDECDKESKVIRLSGAEENISEPIDSDLGLEKEEQELESFRETVTESGEIEKTTQTPIKKEVKSTVIKVGKQAISTPKTLADKEFVPKDAIGIVIQSEQRGYLLSTEKSNLLSGAIKQEFQRKLYPGQVLITANEKIKEMPSAIVEVKEIKSFPKTLSAPFRKIDMFNILIETSPFMYYENQRYSKVLFPANFSSHYFRLPSKPELMRIMNLFGEGINLGLVTYEMLENELPDMELIYKYPFSFKETGYKGIFVVGSPGKGKTNLLKILINGISQYVGTRDGLPPAVIVLDITGQFGQLNKPTKNATTFDEELWKLMDMKIVNKLKVFKIIYDCGDGTHTLSLNAIDPELISLLFPELPPTSSTNFKRMVKMIFKDYPAVDYENFTNKINEIIRRESNTLNSQVAKAIQGAITNGPVDIFDQGGNVLQIKDILVPGQVSVIQIDHIVDKMPVLLYLLLMINRKKIYENDQTPVIMVLDEAHELFPKSANPGEKEYLRRVSQSLIRIARRGRKKHFGLIFASQQPHDIIPEIIGVFQTKIIMGLEATSGNWIKDTLGREYVTLIFSLGQGYARIWNAELHKGTLVPLFIPKAPNKHEED